MKRYGIIALVAICACATAFGGMRDRDFDFSVIATATNTAGPYVLRGDLHGIYIDVAANSTQTVTVAAQTSGAIQTLYTKAAITADVWVPLLYAQYGSTGSALTFVGGTNNTANVVYRNAPLAGPILVTVTGAAGTTATNASTVTVVYDQ